MTTIQMLTGPMRLLPPGARRSHRALGRSFMAAGALVAFAAWMSGLRMELRS